MTHWRHTARQITFLGVDASAFVPVLILIIYPLKTHWTFTFLLYLSIAMVVFLAIAQRRNYQPRHMLLLIRAKAGSLLTNGIRPRATHLVMEERAARRYNP